MAFIFFSVNASGWVVGGRRPDYLWYNIALPRLSQGNIVSQSFLDCISLLNSCLRLQRNNVWAEISRFLMFIVSSKLNLSPLLIPSSFPFLLPAASFKHEKRPLVV